MKKTALILLISFLSINLYSQNSKLFEIKYSKIKGKQMFQYNIGIGFSGKDNSITYIDGNKIYSSPKVKMQRSYFEQGLYIEEFISKDLLSKGTKYIYKFAYDSKERTPVLVTEISFKTKRNYQIQFYYTDYYFELRNKTNR